MWCFLFSVLIVYTGKPVSATPCVELDPPSVEVKYGDSLSASCRSLSNQTDGMGWESPYGGTSLTSGVTSLPFHIAKVKAWHIESKCYMDLLNGEQCGENLPITIYKMPDSVSISNPLNPMVEGQQYNIQCNITNVAPARLLRIYWHKDDNIIDNKTFTDTHPGPVNESSVYTLTAHRDDNGAQIWCEAVLILRTVQEMSSSKKQMTILYPPAFTKPENETVELPYDNKMTLNCTAAGNPAPSYSWRLPQATQQTNKLRVDESLLTPSFPFPGSYACTASNSQGTRTKYFNVVPAKRDRTTFAAIVGGCVALGVVIAIVGLVLVKSDGTFSLNKGGYMSGQPTSSGPV